MKSKLLSLFVLCTIAASSLYAQCNCDYSIKSKHPVRNEYTPADFPGIQGGDVICLEAERPWVPINFVGIKGTAGNPIIIQNCGGKVEITGIYVGIQFEESEYIKVTGTGDQDVTYGILIDSLGNGGHGLNITNRSSDIEVEYVEVAELKVGASGIQAKTDPNCNDSMTWRQNFTMKNIKLHNLYLHETGDEGIYVGYTGGYATSKLKCGPMNVETFGHLIEGVEIYDNIIENTGRDGLQVSLCHKDLIIRDNFINNYGRNELFDQNFGLSMGSGSLGRVYNNIVIQPSNAAPGTKSDTNSRGISILNALTPSYIYNNVVVTPGGPGIWMHQRLKIVDQSQGWYVINNTIVNPGHSGIFYNSTIPGATPPDDQEELDNAFYNNIIVRPGSNYANSGFWKGPNEEFVDFNKRLQRDFSDKKNNFQTDSLPELMFKDTVEGQYDFRIDSMSPAKDYGINVSAFGITDDYEGKPRQSATDTVYDAGAFEWAPTPVGIDEANKQKDFKVYPNPSNGKLNITINLKHGSDARVRLVDFRGATIVEKTIDNLKIGENDVALDFSDIKFRGAALLIVFTGDKTRSSTVILE